MLSAARAGSRPVQPILCLLVSPTRDRETPGCRHPLAGGSELLVRAFWTMRRGGAGGSAESNQHAQDNEKTHCCSNYRSSAGIEGWRFVPPAIWCGRRWAPSRYAFTINQIGGMNRGRRPQAGGPNQVVSASARPWPVLSPTHATYPSGRIRTAAGAVTAPMTGSSHAPTYSASTS